jgi:hypothetical protein
VHKCILLDKNLTKLFVRKQDEGERENNYIWKDG